MVTFYSFVRFVSKCVCVPLPLRPFLLFHLTYLPNFICAKSYTFFFVFVFCTQFVCPCPWLVCLLMFCFHFCLFQNQFYTHRGSVWVWDKNILLLLSFKCVQVITPTLTYAFAHTINCYRLRAVESHSSADSIWCYVRRKAYAPLSIVIIYH